MKYVYTLILILFAAATARAQQNRGEISGTLIDSANRAPVVYATVGVYSVKDTVLLGYKVSDEKGVFKITGLPLTDLRIVVTSTGYSIFRRAVVLDQQKPAAQLGMLTMAPSSVNLNEVIVKSERPPIIVRKDTIEFNAAAFKTLPDALVEDLLKKLPGVNVDQDGNIRVNGKKVTTIYVDGKDFFGGDVRIASKNLPANIIDRVQVSNDQEVLKSNPLMSEAEIPQVINLKLNPNIKKGIFGKMYGGAGVKDKFETGALLNLFRDTTQISLLGYGNNLNKASFSFTDIRSVGGFDRGGWGNANGSSTGGLSIDKVSFGGVGQGLMTSTGGGGNFNTIINKKVQFNLSYFYGQVNSDYDEIKNTRQIYSDTAFNYRQNMNEQAGNYAHMVSTKVQFNVSKNLAISWKNTAVFSQDHTNDLYHINSSSDQAGLLNTSENEQLNKNKGFTYISWFNLLPNFSKKGRNLFFMNYTSLENLDGNLFNNVNSVFYQPPSTSVVNQLRKTRATNGADMLYIRYSDLLNENLNFSIGTNTRYFVNKNDLSTFLLDAYANYTVPVPSATEDFTRSGLRSESTANLKWRHKKFSITPTVGLGLFIADNRFSNAAPVNQRFSFFLPALEIAQGAFSVNYQTSFQEPNMLNLQPVPNNTNPLYIRYGNPELKPAYNNTLSLNARKYDTQRSLTYNASVNTTFIDNATIVSRTVNSTGLQTSTPVNANGTRNITGSFLVQKDWKLQGNKQFSFLLSGSSGVNQTLVLLNGEQSKAWVYNIKPSAELRMNLNDKLEVTQGYTFTNFRSTYQSSAFNGLMFNVHDSKSEVIYRPGKFVLESTLDYRYNGNQVPGLLKSYYKWNAAVTYLFLKGNRGQLKLSANDILDQNVLAQRIIAENLVGDIQGSTIRRYGLLTFTYNIRNFGEKVGGRNKLF